MEQAKEFEVNITRLLFDFTRESYSNGRNSFEKVELFRNSVAQLDRYTPKLYDFCLQVLLTSDQKNSLLRGSIKKFRKEPDHFSIDIAIAEIAQKSNGIEIDKTLTPLNYFCTCDKAQFVYSNIGFQLELMSSGTVNNDRIYFPDFSFYNQFDKKTRYKIYELFKIHSEEYMVEALNKAYPNWPITIKGIQNLKVYKNSGLAQIDSFEYYVK
ncbi:MAG: hypothetical protein AAF600_15040 [Bacteroidota bacterium]